MTTDQTVDCYNCGRSNPEWAQVCRSCGVVLRHGQARVVPSGPFPTDPRSLVSIAAVVGTILGAVLLGLFLSSMNPTDPTIGVASASPLPSASPTPEATEAPPPSATPEPTPEPTPTLPGTIVFGSQLDRDGMVTEDIDTFTPPMAFAYSVSMEEPFGVNVIENEIAKLNDEGENIVLPRQEVPVDPDSSSFGYVIGTAGNFLNAWGPGRFEWRVYVDGELAARGRFRYSEG